MFESSTVLGLENYVQSSEFLLEAVRRIDRDLEGKTVELMTVENNQHQKKRRGKLKHKMLHGYFFFQQTETISEPQGMTKRSTVILGYDRPAIKTTLQRWVTKYIQGDLRRVLEKLKAKK